jgi:hypothetical protein
LFWIGADKGIGFIVRWEKIYPGNYEKPQKHITLTAHRQNSTMKIKSVLFIAATFIYAGSFAQISAAYDAKTNKMGVAIGPTNANGERDLRAANDCVKNGGFSPRAVTVQPALSLVERYGCYAIVTGRDKDGNIRVQGYDVSKTKREAVSNATYHLVTFGGALPNTVSTYLTGCLEKPKDKPVVGASPASHEWSEWKPAPCYKGIFYRVRHFAVFDLNKQYHYYFEVKNTYTKNVSFEFNLLDETGTIRFGNRHTIRAGQMVPFNHKMTDNYIRSFEVTKLQADYRKEYLACDAGAATDAGASANAGVGNGDKGSNDPSKIFPGVSPSMAADLARMVDLMCEGLALGKQPETASNNARLAKMDMEIDGIMARAKKTSTSQQLKLCEKLVDDEMRKRGCIPSH